jgi:hypothetical protein
MCLCFQLSVPATALAATDGIYRLSEVTSVWDGTDANRLSPASSDFDCSYGDEGSLVYTLPWNLNFYGNSYSQIVVDANGFIRFASPSAGSSFNLATTGMGPVIAVWNNDLSSYYYGGIYVQHKTAPERVVIEWQAETYTEEGFSRASTFEAVIFQDGTIRFDYKSFSAASGKDFGSGISKGDGTYFLSVTSTYGNVSTLAGRSYQFIDVSKIPSSNLSIVFSGTGQGTVTSSPPVIGCNSNCSTGFPTGEQITLHPNASQYSLFTGWINGVCSGVGDCLLTLASDSSATAVFDYDVAHQVLASGGTNGYFSSIQSAYDVVADNTTINLWATTYNESVVCDRPVTINLQGGYNSSYSSIAGSVILNGSLKIQNGKVTASGLVIR